MWPHLPIILPGRLEKGNLEEKGSFFVFSFHGDYQMVMDAQVVLSVVPTTNPAEAPTLELLYPPRHEITLPLNNLNFIFEDIQTSFNQTTKLTSDKYGESKDFTKGLFITFACFF